MPATIMPTFLVPAPVRPLPNPTPDVAYPEGPLLDFATMSFVTDTAGRLVIGSGYQVWVQWCAKAVYATRYAHRAYTAAYGLELGGPNPVHLGSDHALVRVVYERSLRETLLADPRTGTVTDFVYEEVADELHVTCTLTPRVPAAGPPFALETWLTRPDPTYHAVRR